MRRELNLGHLGMGREIVRGSIRETDALDPSEARLDLTIPAVVGIVRHLWHKDEKRHGSEGKRLTKK